MKAIGTLMTIVGVGFGIGATIIYSRISSFFFGFLDFLKIERVSSTIGWVMTAVLMVIITLVFIGGYMKYQYACYFEDEEESEKATWTDEKNFDYEHESELNPKFMSTGCYNVLIPIFFHTGGKRERHS